MDFLNLIESQRGNLSNIIGENLRISSEQCAKKIIKSEKTEEILKQIIDKYDYAKLAYITDHLGVQISANVSKDEFREDVTGQDLSNRPYFDAVDSTKLCYLSKTYISRATLEPCISAAHKIFHENKLIGLLFVDLNIDNLPIVRLQKPEKTWQQIKGDPSIRSNLFNQNRHPSLLDRSIDDVHKIATKLFEKYGVFHLQIHYASSRLFIRTYNNPHYDNIHTVDEVINPELFLIYSREPYPIDAVVTLEQIGLIFDQFKYLRFIDDNLYLRTASINIIDGTVSLNFSCDGSHFLTAEEFLLNLDKFS